MSKGLLIDFGSGRSKDITRALRTNGAEFDTTFWSELSAEMIEANSWFVMSGSPTLLTKVDNEPFVLKAGQVFQCNKPIFAICFSHQLLGLHHGANVRLMEKESREPVNIKLESQDPVFADLPNLMFDEDHCEEIDVPSEFYHLASSDICKNESMKHKKLPHYGFQFHPETSNKPGLKLFENFLEITQA